MPKIPVSDVDFWVVEDSKHSLIAYDTTQLTGMNATLMAKIIRYQ